MAKEATATTTPSDQVPKVLAKPEKALREDLQKRKKTLEKKGWLFEPVGEKWVAKIVKPNGNPFSTEPFTEFGYLLSQTEEFQKSFENERKEELFEQYGVSKTSATTSESKGTTTGQTIPMDSGAKDFAKEHRQQIIEAGWSVDSFGGVICPDGVEISQAERDIEKLLNSLGWKSQTQLHREAIAKERTIETLASEAEEYQSDLLSPEQRELTKTSRFAGEFEGKTIGEIVHLVHQQFLGKTHKKWSEEDKKLYDRTGLAVQTLRLEDEYRQIDEEFCFNQVGTFMLQHGLIQTPYQFHYKANIHYGYGSTAPHFEFWNDEKTPTILTETGYRSSFPNDPLKMDAKSFPDYVEKVLMRDMSVDAFGKKKNISQVEILDIQFSRTEFDDGNEYRESLKAPAAEEQPGGALVVIGRAVEAEEDAEAAPAAVIEDETDYIDAEEVTAEDAASTADKQKQRFYSLPETVIERVRYELLDSEKNKALQEKLQLELKIDAEKARFEEEKAKHKAEIKTLETEAGKLKALASLGYEYRNVECVQILDAKRGEVRIYERRFDRQVGTRKATKKELQMSLFEEK
jgi:hypothetical protein